MKFISLTTMIMSALAMAGIATARTTPANPNGSQCGHPEQYECGTLANYNNDNPFLFFCSPESKVDVVQNCDCAGCCAIDSDGVGTCL
ncbi:hypothetical protein M405DRAFT_812962 [Rhizopogon salebrosus TDB-379]|nr:hypothetical protein M405DRAFT_812962 [Rhizopogon salebrosus TDB-379]